MKKKRRNIEGEEWGEARRICRLSADDVRKAKALGFQPRSLIKNRPSKSQLWKAPVHIWVRELYDAKFPGQARDARSGSNSLEKRSNSKRGDVGSARPMPTESDSEPDADLWGSGERYDDGDDCPF